MSLKGKITSVALTDTGKVREHNEDMIGSEADIGLFVLADGMGGYNAGEVASGMCTAFIKTELGRWLAEAPHPPLRAFRPDLPECVEKVIDRALAKNPEERYDSGAQMAAALDDCRQRIPSGSP